MKKKLNILIVDDHPIIVEGYKNALLSIELPDHDIHVDTTDNCEDAYRKIRTASHEKKPYDVLLLDIKLPPSSNGRILSGEDLGTIARNLTPQAKIVVITMFNENPRIHNILKTIDPDGFLIKSDLTSNEFLKAFRGVMEKPPYYSHTVNNFLRLQSNSDVVLDDIDRSILYHLSQGIRTKNLTEYVSLSLAGIEKRKRLLKQAFGVESHDDEKLLEIARERGFI